MVCDGVSSSGLWSSEEQAMHINWLELSAVLFGVKCFVHSHNCLVKVYCGNNIIFQVVQIYRPIHSLGSIIETLSGNFTQLCLKGLCHGSPVHFV